MKLEKGDLVYSSEWDAMVVFVCHLNDVGFMFEINPIKLGYGSLVILPSLSHITLIEKGAFR